MDYIDCGNCKDFYIDCDNFKDLYIDPLAGCSYPLVDYCSDNVR